MTEELVEEVEGEEYEEDSSDLTHDEDLDAAFEAAVSKLSEDEGGDEHPETEIPADKGETEDGQEEPPAPEPEEPAETQELAEDLPNSWNHKEDAKAWEGLPTEARAIVKRRESELLALVNKKANEFNGAKAEYEAATKPLQHVLTELEPIVKKWRAEGKTTTEGLLRAVATREYILETPPLELAKKFLKKSGKGPEALVESYSSKRDEEIEDLRNELSTVKNGLTERQEREQQALQQQTVAQTQDSIRGAWEQFASTKNAFGEALYPSAENKWFREKLGSLVLDRALKFPGQDPAQLISTVYREMEGQIQNASNPRSANAGKIRRAATTAYGKGTTTSKEKFDTLDSAIDAAAVRLGLTE